MPSFLCDVCGRRWSDSFNVSVCPNLFKHPKREVQPMITFDPEVMSGEPCITGHRIPTRAVWEFHQAGYTVERILQEYPTLNAAEVEAAIRYCQEHPPRDPIRPESARERELVEENLRLREANRRLQAEGPALERDPSTIRSNQMNDFMKIRRSMATLITGGKQSDDPHRTDLSSLWQHLHGGLRS